jgi:hypothetical protein
MTIKKGVIQFPMESVMILLERCLSHIYIGTGLALQALSGAKTSSHDFNRCGNVRDRRSS